MSLVPGVFCLLLPVDPVIRVSIVNFERACVCVNVCGVGGLCD